jgi:hypothetical protein
MTFICVQIMNLLHLNIPLQTCAYLTFLDVYAL